MQTTKDVLQLTLLLVSIVGGSAAVITYLSDARRRRAQWLMSLFQKFYEEPHYKEIRFILDYRPRQYDELRQLVLDGTPDTRAEHLVDYLNFFEFVGSIWRLGQLSLEDLKMLFEYYIRNLRGHDWLVEFIHAQGFESLGVLLKELEGE